MCAMAVTRNTESFSSFVKEEDLRTDSTGGNVYTISSVRGDYKNLFDILCSIEYYPIARNDIVVLMGGFLKKEDFTSSRKVLDLIRFYYLKRPNIFKVLIGPEEFNFMSLNSKFLKNNDILKSYSSANGYNDLLSDVKFLQRISLPYYREEDSPVFCTFYSKRKDKKTVLADFIFDKGVDPVEVPDEYAASNTLFDPLADISCKVWARKGKRFKKGRFVDVIYP